MMRLSREIRRSFMDMKFALNSEMLPEDAVLLTVADTAKYLNLGQKKTRELMNQYRTKFVVQVGRTKYVHKDLLDKWLLAQVIGK